MISKRKFYKTIITIEVLSEEPYNPDSVQEIDYDITDGDCSGKFDVVESIEVDAPTMAALLKSQGSDPEFFQLDDEGNDLEDDFEEEGWA
jgi:hypothetical protein